VFLTEKVVTILSELKAWYEQRLAEINAGRAKKHLEPKTMSEFVFPSPDGEQAVAWVQKAAQRIRDASGVVFVPHDLRRTAATLMSGNRTPRVVLKMILNHVDRDITAVYDRYSYDAEKEKALTAWGRKLESILSEKPGDAVLPFRLKRAV
jgi:integrase